MHTLLWKAELLSEGDYTLSTSTNEADYWSYFRCASARVERLTAYRQHNFFIIGIAIV